MRQKSWTAGDVALPSTEDGKQLLAETRNDQAFESLLQAATLVAGGESTGGTCGAGVPPWWTRRG
jgi:hypothetical protein